MVGDLTLPGTRKVEVKKDGFSVDGKELTFKDGDREVFTARLQPSEPRVAKADAPPPEKSPPPPDTTKPNPPPVAGAADDDKGFVPLFNGKDLTGWSVAPIETGNYQGWAVEEGALVGHGDDYKTRNFLFADREYADFQCSAFPIQLRQGWFFEQWSGPALHPSEKKLPCMTDLPS